MALVTMVPRFALGPVAVGFIAMTTAVIMAGCGGSPATSAPELVGPCTPGMSIACAGPGACNGFQVCRPDGGGYGACDCNTTGSDEGGSLADGSGGDAGGTARGAADGGLGEAAAGTADGMAGGPDGKGSSMTSSVGISQSSMSGLETETQLVVAPDGTIAVAWIAFSSGTDVWIGYRFSTDGGATFSAIRRLQLPSGLLGADPGLAVDRLGNFYLSALGVHLVGMTADYTRVFVAKAMGGSTVFGAPVEVSNPSQTLLNDHPKILVTAKGTIVVGYAESPAVADAAAPPTTSLGRVATSKDGRTWQLGTIVGPPSAQFVNLFWFCEGAGILYVTYLESTMTSGYVALRSSTDDGATWIGTSTVASLPTEIVAGLDPSCVASGSDVWIEYATTPSPATDPNNWLDSAQAIRIAHSADRGSTVGATRIDAMDTAAGALGVLPVLVREPGGSFDVAYLTGGSEGDAKGSMRYVRDAIDAGFAPSMVVDGPITFTMSRAMNTWLGDYLGAVTYGSRLLASYPMNAGGTTHVFFRSVPLQ